MDPISLAKKLIEIPSFVSDQTNETQLGEYLYTIITTQFSNLVVQKQEVKDGRFNLFFTDKYPTRLLVIDHLDTVPVSSSWTLDPFTPKVTGDRLYGLGSSDTKGNIAAFLSALSQCEQTKGLGILLYVDEEYYFSGMKTFVESQLARSLNPEYVFSIDGSGLELGNGCRGVVELTIELEGTTGHSASKSGVDSIMAFYSLILELERYLQQFKSDTLGSPTVNVARCEGGQLISRTPENITFGKIGNKVPDFLRALVEIRTTSVTISKEKLDAFFSKQQQKLQLKKLSVQYGDFCTPYETPVEKLTQITQCIQDEISPLTMMNPATFGYLDIAMLKEVFPEATLFSLGAGTVGKSHTADESVSITDLTKASTIYKKLIQTLL